MCRWRRARERNRKNVHALVEQARAVRLVEQIAARGKTDATARRLGRANHLPQVRVEEWVAPALQVREIETR